MQPQTDNYKSRLSRVYVADREFIDDKNNVVKYKRLVLEVLVKGEVFSIEYKTEAKDLAILKLADVVDQPQFGEQE